MTYRPIIGDDGQDETPAASPQQKRRTRPMHSGVIVITDTGHHKGVIRGCSYSHPPLYDVMVGDQLWRGIPASHLRDAHPAMYASNGNGAAVPVWLQEQEVIA